jgi:3-deoxy-manno-octulosonate cytidylyltransferase (CMP-KDO synthetase)
MKVVAIIPARYRSTRFPGKPLADIRGLPMIVHVYRAVAQCSLFDWITVATDDERIGQVCDKHGMAWMMTSSEHPTGTDRVAEVASEIEAAIYVNIQGDEPMLKPEVIEAAARPLVEDTEQRLLVTNLCSLITDPAELIDTNVIKVALARDGRAIYLSRQPIPYPKSRQGARYLKQVCVYGFRRAPLLRFAALEPGPLESAEGIELLRFIENGIPVRFFEVESRSVAVDTPEDLERVNALWPVGDPSGTSGGSVIGTH